MLYVGIDIAKHKHDLAVIDTEGTVFVRHLQIENNREGFAKNQSLRKTKTDKKDAMTIARKLRKDFDKQCFNTQPLMIELKYLTRHTTRLKEECTRKKISYTRILDILFPELTPSLGSSSAKHRSYVYAILKEYPSARKLGNAHLTKLTNLISTHSKGHLGKDHAIKLKTLTQTSIGQESPALEFELLQTIDTIQYLTTMRDEAEKEVARLMSEIDSAILTIPGIGFKLGSVILAEIRDINNFRSPNQLLAYASAEHSVSTSGMNQTETGRMVKHGSSQLRWALHESARLMSIWSPSMRVYFQKKLAEEKHYNVAISHVVRKLVRIIYQLLKDNKPYEEQKMIIN